MKSIRELREQYQVITENEEKEQRKLNALVRAGLFDAKNIPMLERTLEKNPEMMTISEKNMVIELLDSLINEVVSNDPFYLRIDGSNLALSEKIIAEAVKTPVTVSDVPSIVVLKRKAVRVYPGGQQVGLYYSQQLDKYVTIPFGEAGIAEGYDLNEKKDDDESNRRFFKRKKITSYDRLEDKKYSKLSPEERKLVTPGKVFVRNIAGGEQALAKAGAAFLLGKKFKRDQAQLKQKKLNVLDKRREKDLQARAQSKKPSLSPTRGVSSSSYVRSGAASGTMFGRFEENNQLNEALPAFVVPAAVAAGRAAIGAGISAGRAALGAGRKALQGYLAKRAANQAARQASNQSGRQASRSASNKSARRLSRLAGTLGAGGTGSGSSSPASSYKTPVTHSHTSQLRTNIVEPRSSRAGDPYLDPATARRYQRQFYNQMESVEVNLDGKIIEINSKVADKVVAVYESLNDNNKEKMVNMLMNEKTQNKIIEFVTRY